jgi:hypothetical protein
MEHWDSVVTVITLVLKRIPVEEEVITEVGEMLV